MKKLLVVGGLPDVKHKLRYGGATVSMQNFVDYLNANKIDFMFAQTNKFSNLKTGNTKPLTNKLYFFMAFLIYLLRADIVMFNFSDNSTLTQFPFLSKLAKRFKKKVVFRKFGGSLELCLKDKSPILKEKVVTAFKNSDLLFFETNEAVEYAEVLIAKSTKILRFPNVRNCANVMKEGRYGKRLLFMSHIIDNKGVREILEVAKKLPSDYTISLYGAIKEEKYKNFNWDSYGISYHGQIASDMVLETLVSHDILLLPSYKEGMPGIVLEALSVGIPSISTTVGGVPDLISDRYNGRLIPPQDSDALLEAVEYFNDENYSEISKNARLFFENNFNSQLVNTRIIEAIMHV